MTHVDPTRPDDYQPTVPPRVRTIAYVVGIIAGIGAVGALTAYDLEAAAGVAAAISAAANALAFGYRPTR